ncbi:hypothetical protein SAMN04487830_101112 [Pseudobutyrivibrio sp. OR37]|uniref:transcriptional regulator n=1 Tax=Pseudobutyrivibrio sp. OR37 TaxID=1798186 RepID=UPI0008E50154|nr:transcriptional regulator [Pseudobutyrivibrio sp. OR37]SFH53521.1 hypothetical protein SAMN04487830_101112 [Pseudobutyrivibrio sp. OR37]
MSEKFTNWETVRSELFTPEEIAESDKRVASMGKEVELSLEQAVSNLEIADNDRKIYF